MPNNMTPNGIDVQAWNILRARQSREELNAIKVFDQAKMAIVQLRVKHKQERIAESERQNQKNQEARLARLQIINAAREKIQAAQQVQRAAAQEAKLNRELAKISAYKAQEMEKSSRRKLEKYTQDAHRTSMELQSQEIRRKNEERRNARQREAQAIADEKKAASLGNQVQ